MAEKIYVERELNRLWEATLRLECELDLAVENSRKYE